MLGYSHNVLLINNREVNLADILSGEATSLSEFESETFSFVRDWLQGLDSFKLHTSGSTGTPKEIILTRKQLQQSAQRTIKALNLSNHNTALVCLDTKHIAGKMMLVRALGSNMKIVALEPTSNPLQKLNSELSNGFAAFVPMQLLEMLKHASSKEKLNQLKTIIIGGSEVDTSLIEQAQKLSCTAFATYGMTETVSHIALQRLNGNEATRHFSVLPDIEIKIDERGCLVITLPEFAEKIITNDLVELITPTSFRWLGRYDNVINSGGYKISPEKIEKAVESIFQERKVKRSFFACGIPDARLGQKLLLVIEGFPISGEKKILSTLKQQLHGYEVPKQILYIREFIRTETGKINRPQTRLLAIG